MSGFQQALPWVLTAEGGYVDDPLDRGGATNMGVTQRVFDGWRASVGWPVKPVADITHEEVEAVYYAKYWIAGKCDALPWPMSLAHFDASVNHGVRGAWLIMQRALRVKPDGVPGPLTMSAIQMADGDLRWRWFKERAGYYVAIVTGHPEQTKFLRGWLNRLFDLQKEMSA